MSKHGTTVLAVVLACVCAAGCAVPDSFLGYLKNRGHDLTDVLHVDFSAVNIGAVAYAGPFLLGADYITGMETRSGSTTFRVGLGGCYVESRKGLAAGVIWPSSRWNEDEGIIGRRPKRAPSGFSAGFSVGLFGGIGAEADLLEAVDFVLGLACIDLTQDDEHIRGAEEKPGTEPPQPETQ